MRYRRRAILISSLLLLPCMASAENLHVTCLSPTTCPANPVDLSIPNTPSTLNFGLTGTGSGDFYLVALVPNNVVLLPTTISATHTQITGAVAPKNIGPFSGGWGPSGELFNVLNTDQGFSTDNGHLLSSFLSATNLAGVDPSATGYEIYTYAFGYVNFGAGTNPQLTIGSMPVGTVFTAFVTTDGTKNVLFDTPNSQALLVTPAGVYGVVPEPRLYGVVLAGLICLLVIVRRRLSSALAAIDSETAPQSET